MAEVKGKPETGSQEAIAAEVAKLRAQTAKLLPAGGGQVIQHPKGVSLTADEQLVADVLRRPQVAVEVRYSRFRGEVEWQEAAPGDWPTGKWQAIDDGLIDRLWTWTRQTQRDRGAKSGLLTRGDISALVGTLARANAVDPPLKWLAECKAAYEQECSERREANEEPAERLAWWLPHYFGAAATPYTQEIGRLIVLGIIGRQLCPGLKFDTMAIAQGAQGVGKSRTWAALVGGAAFTDCLRTGSEEKTVLEQARGVLLAEDSEIAGLRGRALETVKASLSRQVDTARPAYGRHAVSLPRRFIQVGSTNEAEFLQDDTGARRFWPFVAGEAGPLDPEGLAGVRDRLFGEGLVEFERLLAAGD